MRDGLDFCRMSEPDAGNFDKIQIEPAVRALRQLALKALGMTTSLEVPKIAIDDASAHVILGALYAAQPTERVVRRTDRLGNKLGLVAGAFSNLNSMERLILEHTGGRSIFENLFEWIWPDRGWIGRGPVSIDTIAPVLSMAAFTDERMSWQVLKYLHDGLRRRILIGPGDNVWGVRLHPTFFCCLLALSLHASGKGRRGRRAVFAHQLLCKMATLMANREGWAGFWEQWLIHCILLHSLPAEAKQLEFMLRKLPLIQRFDAIVSTGDLWAGELAGDGEPEVKDVDHLAEEGAVTDLQMGRENWQADAPSFSVRLISGSL